MSRYKVIATEFKNRASLIAGLQEAGVVCEQAQGNLLALYGYQGDARPERAEIVVRRQQISVAANDLGFARNATGGYDCIISEYDSGYDGREAMQLLSRIKQSYAAAEVTRQARARGYTVQRRVENGVVRLQLVRH